MRGIKQKILAWVLVLVMTVTLIPQGSYGILQVQAAESAENISAGSSEDVEATESAMIEESTEILETAEGTEESSESVSEEKEVSDTEEASESVSDTEEVSESVSGAESTEMTGVTETEETAESEVPEETTKAAGEWNAAKTGSVTIGGTVFTLTAGADSSADFSVTASGGEGFVEVAASEKAVVWADLGGDGKGALKASDVTDLTGSIASTAISGNELSLIFSGEDTPSGYTLIVRDSSGSGKAKADGAAKTYNFTDGSVISNLYDGTYHKVTGGNSVSSTDRLVTITAGASGVYYNGSHGIVVKDGTTVKVKVAGNATVAFSLCNYSDKTGTISASAETGSVYVTGEAGTTSCAIMTATDGASTEFTYEGDATELTFTMNSASAQSYLHSMTVTNEAESTTVNDNLGYQVPEILNVLGNADNLTVKISGQTLNLIQSGGAMTTTDTSTLSSFGFPAATAENYRLEADVKILSIDSKSNNYGIFLGVFDNKYTALAGVRSATNLRGIYSKGDTKLLDAGQVNQTVEEGVTIHYEAYKADDAFYIETTCEEDGQYYKGKYQYNSSSFYLFKDNGAATSVYYGLIAAGVTATVTNMKYYDADGNILFDQNEYYNPIGSAPVVKSVSATADESREFITVNWSGESVSGDGKYVLQVSKDGSGWTDVATNLTDMSYTYPVTEAGYYTFRVCGTLGNSESQALNNRNSYVTSNEAYIMAALTAPEVTVPYQSKTSGVNVSWNAVEGAERYEIYRRSSDETVPVKIGDTTGTTYTDTAVTAEVPYYYSVQAFCTGNYSNLSAEAWTLPSDGHSGEYVYEEGELFITKKSYDTVFEGKVYLEGVATEAGTVAVYVNDVKQAEMKVGVRETFSFPEIAIEEGRNDVTLIETKSNGDKIRKSFNFVYLTNYDMVVDAAFTGTDGETDSNGIPQYSTVEAALAAANTNNTETSRQTIFIKAGDYEEKTGNLKQLIVSKPYITLIGEDSQMVRLHNQPLDLAKEASATSTRCFLYVQTGATGFSAENLTVENDWEYRGDGSISNESSDAIMSEAEGAVYTNVRFLGYQDTINPNKNHQYYYKCYIAGNVDFIYGSAGMAVFEDCDIVFRYNANKNSGYVTAPKSDGVSYGLIFDNCRITAETGCSGSKYYLGRPWGETSAVTYIDCYMGSVINAEWGWTTWGGKELSSDSAALEKSRYYECGTYGPGFAVNVNRRQISPTGAENMLSDASLGWAPASTLSTIGADYEGTIVTTPSGAYVENEYKPTTYSGYESDDTGAGRYNLEGFAQSSKTTGGGLLYEDSDNYYKVSNANEFLDAVLSVKKTGLPSVIELDADICLGENEVENFASYSSILTAHTHPAQTHPLLMQTGVTKLSIKGMNNLTIFSNNGYSIKHTALDINDSDNIIIRNIRFDELWEWDEETAGDYDVNDWDYVTVQAGSNRIWIDHCSFYKAYDGVVDIKTDKTTATNVTISWCEFLPGSEDNVFFNQMMDTMAANPQNYPYYNSLLNAGMTTEQIWWYAYGQKKTHLVGQSDEATTAENISLTLANNYYFDSMDRMPRLRYGTAHVYNCIMDAQELLTARDGITNAEAAKHIVSNGASSTCDAEVLLENCYINGIINALNSGNGSSPSGYINAVNSLYYMYGQRYALNPKVNTTKEGEALKVLDADAFTSELPYSNYTLYSASDLASIVKENAGAGKVQWTPLQWEKTVYYDSTWTKPEASGTTNDGLPEFTENNGNTGDNNGSTGDNNGSTEDNGGNTGDGNNGAGEVHATAVTLNRTDMEVEKGKTCQLTAEVTPKDSTDGAVTWTSSKASVASVDANGLVTAKKTGETVITATTAGGLTATCKVTVIISAEKIYLTPALCIKKGSSKTLKASIFPADTTDKVTWSTSNKKVVTVTSKGKIKGVKAGTATITAKMSNGKKATCKVTVVKDTKKATSIKLSKKTLTLKKGAYTQLKATLSKNSTDKVTWSSSNKKVAKVDTNGVVTALKGGIVTITAKAASGKKATCKVTVKEAATKVKLNKTKATLKKGGTLTLKATVTPSSSTDKLTWSSSNKKVAAVDSKGKVTAKKKGTAVITVKTASGKKATCSITVK